MPARICQLLTRAMGSTSFSYTLKLIWLAGRPSSPLHRRKWRRGAQLNTELTNGRGAKWSPKVVSSPFSTLLRYRFSICPICPICRPRVVVFLDSKQKQEIARSLPNILSYLNLQIRPLQTLKQQTFFLLGSGLRIELFLPALQPNRCIEKRPWRLYSQATLVQSHKVKPVLT